MQTETEKQNKKEASPKRRPKTLPLARFAGEKPPAPNWFKTCLDAPFDRGEVQVSGAKICYKAWGERGKPGLILVHGGVAHKGWWDFIAPWFSRHRRVVAMDLSGMGDSDWRDVYDMPLYADEVLATAEAGGAFEHARKPVLAGHSFGGFVTLGSAVRHGTRFERAVVIDSPVRPAEMQRRTAPPSRGGKIYDTQEEILSRFRLLPDQDCDNPYLLDHIAREAMHEVSREGKAPGWAWKFDPNLWNKMQYDMRAAVETISEFQCPVALIRGENSLLVNDEVWGYMCKAFPGQTPRFSIPEARHHVMLDQPLALVSALRALISCAGA
jgi:pimeloyl-ACP methyl ester carboxylesterase